ncbi:MAG: DUF507 family protein [Myxococcota bacterium]|jgi:hypothetical protein|nr:DUF507 family protein [Myxococcota bacterium]
MKLFPGKVSLIAGEVTRLLVDEKDIETDSPSEVELDVEAVLKEYIRTDRELTDQAKDLCEKRSMPFSAHMKVKRQLAEKARFVVGDEALDYIMDQIIRAFMHSQFVDEIFAEDHDLKRKIRPILKRHTEIEEQIDEEVRSKIKNLEEGTKDWEIEYGRVLSQVKKRRSLE